MDVSAGTVGDPARSPSQVVIEVWSDPLYPDGHIAKRNLERLLANDGCPDSIEVVWRSFEILPGYPSTPGETLAELKVRLQGLDPEFVAERVVAGERRAAEVGLTWRLATARPTNSYDAHRLIHFASERGLGEAMVEALFVAYLESNLAIASHEVLAEVAAGVGLDRAEVLGVLAGNAYARAVEEDRVRSVELGVSTVPTVTVNGTIAFEHAPSLDELATAVSIARGGSPG